MEKKNLHGRLEYFQKLYPTVNPIHNKIYNFDNDNNRINEENLLLLDKLSIYQNFYKELENILLKQTTCINVIKNLDTFALRRRCEKIINELNTSMFIKEKSYNNKLKNALKLNNVFSLKLKAKKNERKNENENINNDKDNTFNNTNSHCEIQNSKYAKKFLYFFIFFLIYFVLFNVLFILIFLLYYYLNYLNNLF
jgi:hypothetical protein